MKINYVNYRNINYNIKYLLILHDNSDNSDNYIDN